MEIKGTTLSNIRKFIKLNFSGSYDEWISRIPEKSQNIYTDIILVSKWFDLNDGYINPVTIAGDMFFNNNASKAAYEVSKFSSMQALQGMYKIFVKIASIDFILKRAVSIFKTFYSSEASLELFRPDNKTVLLKIKGFKIGHEIIIDAIAGWADGIFTTINQNDFNISNKITHIEGDTLFAEIYIYLK